jgi:hypothetical protein
MPNFKQSLKFLMGVRAPSWLATKTRTGCSAFPTAGLSGHPLGYQFRHCEGKSIPAPGCCVGSRVACVDSSVFRVILRGARVQAVIVPATGRSCWVSVPSGTSQRSLHNEPIFRLLLKVAVKGTHECDFANFLREFCSQHHPFRLRPGGNVCAQRSRISRARSVARMWRVQAVVVPDVAAPRPAIRLTS